ncbi:hypothetical protein GCM10010129_39370 [Streptomyces fumigatiscleroticus]|nr:hypothetical protein GCM10010129_39370 [Streptomyces fumigatiscleroticus]
MAAGDAAYSVGIGPDGTWTFYEYGTAVGKGAVAASDSYRLAVEAKGATITAYVLSPPGVLVGHRAEGRGRSARQQAPSSCQGPQGTALGVSFCVHHLAFQLCCP